MELNSQTSLGLEPASSQSLQVTNSPVDASAQTVSPLTLLSAENSQGMLQFTWESKPQKLTEPDDIEHFLITNERTEVACSWQKS